MPESYHCKACKVGFAVGWFHYHDHPNGYAAGTLLVCSACGTMHAVEHPAPVFVPVLGGLFHRQGAGQKNDRLLAQDGPLRVDNPEAGDFMRLKDWRQCEVNHCLCPGTEHNYLKDFIDLKPVKCRHCGRAATLVKEWSWQNVRCPACGQPELEAGESWIT